MVAIWLGFVDRYRTLCLAPDAGFRQILDRVKEHTVQPAALPPAYPGMSLARRKPRLLLRRVGLIPSRIAERRICGS